MSFEATGNIFLVVVFVGGSLFCFSSLHEEKCKNNRRVFGLIFEVASERKTGL